MRPLKGVNYMEWPAKREQVTQISQTKTVNQDEPSRVSGQTTVC